MLLSENIFGPKIFDLTWVESAETPNIGNAGGGADASFSQRFDHLINQKVTLFV